MEEKVKKSILFLEIIKSNKFTILSFILIFIMTILLFLFSYTIFFDSKKINISKEDERLFLDAKQKYLEKKLKDSINILEKLVKKNKNFFNARFMLGKAYFFDDQIELAKKTWEENLKRNPSHINSLIWLGILYNYDEKNKDKSILIFSKVLELDGQNLIANYNLAKIYFNLKEYKRALYHFNNALENELHLAEVHFELAKVYFALGLEERALEELKRAENLLHSEGLSEEIKEFKKKINKEIKK